MTDLTKAKEVMRTVTLYRRRGDAAARRGDVQEASQSWSKALTASDEAFSALSVTPELEPAQAKFLAADVAAELAEVLGVRGGLLRRLGRTSEALESYRSGALLEQSHELPQTYNRTNAIKLALIVDGKTLAEVRDELAASEEVLDRRLSTDALAADDAWLWADLGDMRLLLGDDQGAASAYRNFVAKARTESPSSTLAVLKEIVAALDSHGDPDAARMAASLNNVEAMIAARLRT